MLLFPSSWSIPLDEYQHIYRFLQRWRQVATAEEKGKKKKLEAATKICLFFSAEYFCCLIAIETKELLLASVGRQKQKGEKHA